MMYKVVIKREYWKCEFNVEAENIRMFLNTVFDAMTDECAKETEVVITKIIDEEVEE